MQFVKTEGKSNAVYLLCVYPFVHLHLRGKWNLLFKMLYIYQELLKKEGITVCQDLMV